LKEEKYLRLNLKRLHFKKLNLKRSKIEEDQKLFEVFHHNLKKENLNNLKMALKKNQIKDQMLRNKEEGRTHYCKSL